MSETELKERIEWLILSVWVFGLSLTVMLFGIFIFIKASFAMLIP